QLSFPGILRLKLVGAAAPLVAEAGEDLVLPCSLQPSISAEGMMVEWSRLHETDTLVHLYEDYKDRNGDQMESYRGRTALFKEELKKGNASLILSPSDEGAYQCHVASITCHNKAIVYVEVKGTCPTLYIVHVFMRRLTNLCHFLLSCCRIWSCWTGCCGTFFPKAGGRTVRVRDEWGHSQCWLLCGCCGWCKCP
uniref:Ig-like domain-containing protein n=1 Tax=Astyanax mexicanus TaxID=7994 RepID=A0A3B1IXN1_ASTMX